MSKIQFSENKFVPMANWTTNFSPKFWIGARSEVMALHQRKKHCSRTMKRLWNFYNPQTDYFKDVHYKVLLLWKEEAKLPNNRFLAQKQIKQLKAEFRISHEAVLKTYEETLRKDLQNGYVVKIDPGTDDKKFASFIPHHPVSNESKPEKI